MPNNTDFIPLQLLFSCISKNPLKIPQKPHPKTLQKSFMNVLELFAGSRSVGKVAQKLSFNVYSSDIEQFGGIDYVTDIMDFDVTKIPFKPDIIWAS
jgi:hypothetical protein